MTISAEAKSNVRHPAAPRTLEEAGLTRDLVLQLALKTLHFAGELSGTDLARRLGLSFPVIEPALDPLKAQQHCEIVGGGAVGPASYRYRITDAGRVRAGLFLQSNQYVGFAPVPLAQYRRYILEFQRLAPRDTGREAVRRAFSHLVVSDRVLDQLGPAVNGGRSLFLYGAPGNGKTVMAQAIRNLLVGEIAIPHALEVEGQIIRFFDPVNHEPLPDAPGDERLDMSEQLDARWVRCRRPMVVVGGELTLEQLDLTYNPTAGFYRAPVQAITNGGVLVIDDFGRQQCSPQALLNRWIVPLESRVDYLTLQSGQKFELPFSALVVFATNLKPAELVDEAFLRRIHFKVFAESPSVEEFIRIFEGCCLNRGILFERRVVEELLQNYYRRRGIELRGCHPRDLIDHALSLTDYFGEPQRLTYRLLEAACASYFVDDREVPIVHA